MYESRFPAEEKDKQVQLWPFLLELLTASEYSCLIRWVGVEGEFEFVEPEQVASMWGQRKGIST